jgi:spore maturation protein CgeB
MKALNNETANRVLDLWKQANCGSPPYACKTDRSYVVTNNQVILEWPLALVDEDSQGVRRLLDNARQPYASPDKFIVTPWPKLIIDKRTQRRGIQEKYLFDCEEVDPNDKEVSESEEHEQSIVVYGYSSHKRLTCNYFYVQMFEFSQTIGVTYRVYDNAGQQTMLIPFEGGKKIGCIVGWGE